MGVGKVGIRLGLIEGVGENVRNQDLIINWSTAANGCRGWSAA